MRRLTLAVAAGLLAIPASAATLTERTLPAGTQAGSLARDYTVAVPDGLDPGTPVPLVMVLHGCSQTEQDMIDDTRFVELVDREGFIAVFPFIKSCPRSSSGRRTAGASGSSSTSTRTAASRGICAAS